MASDIKKKATNSAIWLGIVGGVSSICSFVITVLLGKISSDLLGKYSLIVSFLNLTATIVCMGGSVILSRYIIREKECVKRSRIFFTYVYLTIVVLIVFEIVLKECPDIYHAFIGNANDTIKTISLLLVMPIYTGVIVVSYFLTSILESRLSKIMGCLYTIGMCVTCVILFFGARDFFNKYFIVITLTVVLVMNIFSLLIGIIYIAKNNLLLLNRETLKPLVPEGACLLALCTLGQSSLSYIAQDVDKVFLSQLSGLGYLGYYQAILHIVAVVELVPKLLGNITIPFFSAIIESEDTINVKKTYIKIEKILILFIASMVFALITISNPILKILGEEYENYQGALVLMLAGKAWASRGYLNTPMLVNMDKNPIRLVNSILQVILQSVLMVCLVIRLGVYGAVIARTIAAIFAQYIPQKIIKNSEYRIGYSKQYIIANVFVSLLAVGVIFWKLSFPQTILLSVLSYLLFWKTAGYSIKDVDMVIKGVIKR